jgi:hypothetical protein
MGGQPKLLAMVQLMLHRGLECPQSERLAHHE